MTKNKKIGIALLASPWVLMILSYALYFISRAIVSSSAPTALPDDALSLPQAAPHETTWRMVSVIAGLLGTLSVILLFVGTILGIYFMAKADDEKIVDTQIKRK
jgi:TRAP-type mannitol/chloroaromatic compound transport system permease large subunit